MSFNKKIITKEFYNIELMNLSQWYAQVRQEHKEKFSTLPFQVQLALRTNMKEIGKTADSLIEMRNELNENIRNKYFTAEKADEIEQDGQKMMKIKDEFVEDYKKEVAECDTKLQEVLQDRTKVQLTVFDMDAMYETLPDECELEMDDIDMLSFMDKVDEVEKIKDEDTVVEGE